MKFGKYSGHTFSSTTDKCADCGLSCESLKRYHGISFNNTSSPYDCGGSMMFSCCGGSGAATWNQTDQKWRCSDCGATQSTDPNYIGNGFAGVLEEFEKQLNKGKKCSCGSSAVGSDRHSDYCDLYVKR